MKARCILDSVIAEKPPYVREIWDYLLLRANHKDRKIGSRIIKRGQCMVMPDEVLEKLKWKKGYCYIRYKKHQYENAMKILRKTGCIAVRKTGSGSIVTIINYDYYQNPKNYDCHSECRNDYRDSAGYVPDQKQELNKDKNKEKKEQYSDYVFLTDKEYDNLCKEYGKEETEDQIKALDIWFGNKPKERNRKDRDDYRRILLFIRNSNSPKNRPFLPRLTKEEITNEIRNYVSACKNKSDAKKELEKWKGYGSDKEFIYWWKYYKQKSWEE